MLSQFWFKDLGVGLPQMCEAVRGESDVAAELGRCGSDWCGRKRGGVEQATSGHIYYEPEVGEEIRAEEWHVDVGDDEIPPVGTPADLEA